MFTTSMAWPQGFTGWFVLLPLLACLARGVDARSLLQAKDEICRLGGTGLSVDKYHPSLAVFNLFFSANCPHSGINGSPCNVTGFLLGSTVTVNSTVYNVTAGLSSYGGPDNLVYPDRNNSVDESGLSFDTSNGTTFLLSYSSQDNEYTLQRSGTALPNSFSLASVDFTCASAPPETSVCVLTVNQPMQAVANGSFPIAHAYPVVGIAASISLSFGADCPYGSANGFPCFASRYLPDSSLTLNLTETVPFNGVNVPSTVGPLPVNVGAPGSGLNGTQFSPDFAVFPGGSTAVDGFGLGFFTGPEDDSSWGLYFFPSQYYLVTNYFTVNDPNYPITPKDDPNNVLSLEPTSVDLRCSPSVPPETGTCVISAESSYDIGRYEIDETLDLYLVFSVACPLGVDNGCNVVSFLPGSQVALTTDTSYVFDVTGLGPSQITVGYDGFATDFSPEVVHVDNVVYPNGIAGIDALGTYYLDSAGLAFNTSNGTFWLLSAYGGGDGLYTDIPDPMNVPYVFMLPGVDPSNFSMTCALPSAIPTTETCRLGGAGASYFGEALQNNTSAFFNLFLSASCAYGSDGFPCNVTTFLPGSTMTVNRTVYKVTAGLGSYGGPDNLVFPGRNKVVDYDGLSFNTSHGDTFLLFYSLDYEQYLVRSDKYGPLGEVPLYEFTDVYFSCASAPPESGTCVLTGHGMTAQDNAVNMALSFATYCPYGSAKGFPCNVTEYLPGSNVTFNGKVYSITPGLGTVDSPDNSIYVSSNTHVDFAGISFTAADTTSFNLHYDFSYFLQSDSGLSARFEALNFTCTLSPSMDTSLQPCGFTQAYNSGEYYGPTVSRSIALNSAGGDRILESLTIHGKHFIISLDFGPAAGVLVANKTKFQFGFFADLASANASTSAACNPSADGALWYYVKYGDPAAISTLPASSSSVYFTNTTITITLPIQQAAYPFLNVPLHALCDQGKLGGAQLLLRAYNTDKLNTTAPPGQCNDDISLAGSYLPFFLTCYCGSV